MVVVGVRTATKVDGVNLGPAGVSRAGAVPDFQDLLEASELSKGIQVVLVDMVNSRMKTTLVVLNSRETVVCHLPQVKKKAWGARVRKVTITRLKVNPLLLPWLKTQWGLGLRQLGLGTGTKEVMATRVAGPDQWEVTKVDSTRCLPRSARIRRTKPRRSLANKWVVDHQVFPTQLRLKWQRSLLLNRLVAPLRRMQRRPTTLQEQKTVKNRKLHHFLELRIGRPA